MADIKSFNINNNDHWDKVFNMYIRKLEEDMIRIKKEKFSIPPRAPLKKKVAILEERNKYIEKLLIREVAKWRTSFVQSI